MCSFAFPALAVNEQEADEALTSKEAIETMSNSESAELNNDESQNVENDVLPSQANIPSKYKAPTSKKKLAKKFIIAMLCVAGTSIFLYGTLSFYNRIKEGFFIENSYSEENTPLDTPQDISEAVKSFVDKTRWQ